MKKISAKKELTEVANQLKGKVLSAKIGVRDGLKMALVNEELKKTGRYKVVQFHRSHTAFFAYMYVGNKFQGTLNYGCEHNIELIMNFLSNHEDVSFFALYSEVI